VHCSMLQFMTLPKFKIPATIKSKVLTGFFKINFRGRNKMLRRILNVCHIFIDMCTDENNLDTNQRVTRVEVKAGLIALISVILFLMLLCFYADNIF